jgi:hypothetical protein
MHPAHRLSFYHNFDRPVRIEGSCLYYDPVRIDQSLSKIMEDRNANIRNASTARR